MSAPQSSEYIQKKDSAAGIRPVNLFVVVPAYNEERSIEATVQGLKAVDGDLRLHGVSLSVMIVNDGSADRTEELARSAGADYIEAHSRNRGLGAAVRTGLQRAYECGADIVVKFDADLQHDPDDILPLICPILESRSDLVYGSRFSRISYRMPFVRRWGNRVFRYLMRWLTKWPIEDSQPGIFAASRDYLTVFEMPGDYNYTQQILLDAFLKQMRFSQVPVSFHERKTGNSFISFKYPYRVLRQLVLVMALTKPMKIFGTAGAVFMLIAAGVFCYQFAWWLFGDSPRPVRNVNLVMGMGLFGVQMFFFGLLAKLMILTRMPVRRSIP